MASERASAVSGRRRSFRRRAREGEGTTGESERCGTIFRRIEFSAVRVGARVRGGGRWEDIARTRHGLTLAATDRRRLDTSASLAPVFFYSSSSSGCHSLPSPFPPYFAILSPPLRSLKRIIVRGIKLFPSPICTSSSSPFPVRSRRSLSRLIGRFCAQPFLEAAGCTGNYYRSTSP